VNTRHEVLDWFRPSRGVIVLGPVLVYYAIEIGFSLFFGMIPGFSRMSFEIVFDVDLSSLFIVREPHHRV
jgi:hypothetical protein